MCGIVGFVSKSKKQLGNLVLSAYAQKWRGEMDGVGLMNWNKRRWEIKKTLYPLTLDLKHVFTGHSKVGVLHHRLASMGEVSLENTHPIQEGNIILVHNGHSIYGARYIEEIDPQASDTRGVAKLLDKYGINFITSIGDGAYVIVKKNKPDLFLYREEYPLYICESKNLITFASTQLSCTLLFNLLSKGKHKRQRVYLLPERQLFKIDTSKLTLTTEIDYEDIINLFGF